jgi:hypothetical protein
MAKVTLLYAPVDRVAQLLSIMPTSPRAAAARRLGLHRNTTLYKLDRVSRVLGMDIRSADTQFMVWLAHHIDTLAQVEDKLDEELAPPP